MAVVATDLLHVGHGPWEAVHAWDGALLVKWLQQGRSPWPVDVNLAWGPCAVHAVEQQQVVCLELLQAQLGSQAVAVVAAVEQAQEQLALLLGEV